MVNKMIILSGSRCDILNREADQVLKCLKFNKCKIVSVQLTGPMQSAQGLFHHSVLLYFEALPEYEHFAPELLTHEYIPEPRKHPKYIDPRTYDHQDQEVE